MSYAAEALVLNPNTAISRGKSTKSDSHPSRQASWTSGPEAVSPSVTFTPLSACRISYKVVHRSRGYYFRRSNHSRFGMHRRNIAFGSSPCLGSRMNFEMSRAAGLVTPANASTRRSGSCRTSLNSWVRSSALVTEISSK